MLRLPTGLHPCWRMAGCGRSETFAIGSENDRDFERTLRHFDFGGVPTPPRSKRIESSAILSRAI
jgi:hypothetical protein